MTQKRWKLSITELGTTKVLAETVVEAGDWMTGLSRARTQIGERAGVPQGASVSVAPDGKVSILDPVGRRQYTLTNTIESLPPPPKPVSVPPPAPPAAKKADFKKTMAYVPAAAGVGNAEKVVGKPVVAPAVVAPAIVAPAAVAPAVVAPAVVAPAVVAPAVVAPAVVAPAVVAPAVVAPGESSTSAKKKVSRATMAYMPASALAGAAASMNGAPLPAVAAQAVAAPAAPAVVAPAAPAPAAPVAAPPAAPVVAAPVEAVVAAVVAPAVTAPAASASAAVETLEVLFARDSEPSAASPLIYRERNWLAPEGTDEEEAELLLRTRFSALRDSLADKPKGKLVKLALFDHRWSGQPLRPPILVLTWKDWRGEPEVLAPGRLSVTPVGTVPAPSVPPPASPSTPAPSTSVAAVATGVAAVATAAPSIPEPPIAPAPPMRASTPPVDTGPSIMIDPSLLGDPGKTLEDVPAVRSVPARPSPAPPAAAPAAALPTPTPQPSKLRADDRLAHAFDALQDLFFLPTPADGADFLLRLLGELVPSEAASIALYDINTDELRFVAAVGTGGSERKGDAVPSLAGILGSAVHGHHDVCTVVADVTTDRRFDPGIDGRVGLEPMNLAVSPVSWNGRLLGALQLVNRIGDLQFSQADANLLAYVAQRFGEFLHQHKVAEPKRVSQSAPGRR
jgi:hypothetical protein